MTTEFRAFADELLAQRNASGLPLVDVQHPIGGISAKEAEARITPDVVDRVVLALSERIEP